MRNEARAGWSWNLGWQHGNYLFPGHDGPLNEVDCTVVALRAR